MDRRMAAALDRYITGNYGEDQFAGVCATCGGDASIACPDCEGGDGGDIDWCETHNEWFNAGATCPECREEYRRRQIVAALETNARRNEYVERMKHVKEYDENEGGAE